MWKGFKNGIVFLRGLTPHQGEEITKWYRGIRREERGGVKGNVEKGKVSEIN